MAIAPARLPLPCPDRLLLRQHLDDPWAVRVSDADAQRLPVSDSDAHVNCVAQ